MTRPVSSVFLALSLIGCPSVQRALDRLSDQELAQHAHDLASHLVSQAVKFALNKAPQASDKIKADGTIAVKALRSVVIPAFGAPLGTVGVAALNAALDQFKAKVQGTDLESLALVAVAILGQVPLPPNPTDKLSPRAHGAILSFFTGMAEGLENALGIPGPAPAPAPQPAPTPK